MAQLKDEDVIDINILLALTKCMGEISHNLQYIHAFAEKKEIKKVINAIGCYEKELEKRFDDSQKQNVESIYDVLMDLILEARAISLNNAKQ